MRKLLEKTAKFSGVKIELWEIVFAPAACRIRKLKRSSVTLLDAGVSVYAYRKRQQTGKKGCSMSDDTAKLASMGIWWVSVSAEAPSTPCVGRGNNSWSLRSSIGLNSTSVG
jgi:hypothetical protein